MLTLETKQIGSNVKIAPTAIIEDGAVVGDNTSIGDYSIIRSGVKIGSNNQIFSHVIIGEFPQDRAYQGEQSYVEIGDSNIIREFVTIHKAAGNQEKTVVGNNNYLMVSAHLAHNVKLGNNITLANSVSLAGHVEVDDFVTFGGSTVVHQNCKIGKHSMLSGLSGVNHDVLPYMIFGGTPSVALSTNRIGMKRAGISQAARSEIMRAFKMIYAERLSMSTIIERLETLDQHPEIIHIIDFIKNSRRGIILNKYSSSKN